MTRNCVEAEARKDESRKSLRSMRAAADGVAGEGSQQGERGDKKKNVARLCGGIRAEGFRAVEQQYEARRDEKESDDIETAAVLACAVGRKNPDGAGLRSDTNP